MLSNKKCNHFYLCQVERGMAFYFNRLESPWHRHVSSQGWFNLTLWFWQINLKGKECTNGQQTGGQRPKNQKNSSKNLTWSLSLLNAKKDNR